MKALFAEYRFVIAIAAAVVLALAFAWFVHHERAIGEQRQISRDAIAVQKQTEAVAAQELADRQAIAARSESYEAQLQALQHDLDNKPSSIVRVRNTACSSPVREAPATSSGPGGTSAAGLDQPNGSDHSVDIGPALDRYKTDAQALALRCQAVIDLWPRQGP